MGQKLPVPNTAAVMCCCLQAAGDERAALALDMFVYRVRKYIGAYAAALSGRVDALVFSAGIGENSSIIRGLICEDMQVTGLTMVFFWLLLFFFPFQ